MRMDRFGYTICTCKHVALSSSHPVSSLSPGLEMGRYRRSHSTSEGRLRERGSEPTAETCCALLELLCLGRAPRGRQRRVGRGAWRSGLCTVSLEEPPRQP